MQGTTPDINLCLCFRQQKKPSLYLVADKNDGFYFIKNGLILFMSVASV